MTDPNYAEQEKLLINRIKSLYEFDNDVSLKKYKVDEKKKFKQVTKQLKKTLRMLEDPAVELSVENIHNEICAEDESYTSVLWHLRTLIDSFNVLNDNVSNRRHKTALPYAATGYLHLRYLNGYGVPKLYDEGDDVNLFKELCASAGLVLSSESYRNALSQAVKKYNRHFYEGYDFFFQ